MSLDAISPLLQLAVLMEHSMSEGPSGRKQRTCTAGSMHSSIPPVALLRRSRIFIAKQSRLRSNTLWKHMETSLPQLAVSDSVKKEKLAP
jgi:hypothetical protein